MFKPWKHVFQINRLGLTKPICLLGKPEVNGLRDMLGECIYEVYTCRRVDNLIVHTLISL